MGNPANSLEQHKVLRDTPVAEPVTNSVAPSSDKRSDARRLFAIGEVLGGNYTILSKIGSGGMGCVYLAHDRALNRQVAIKASFPGIAADTLSNEAKVLAAFRHAGLPTVFAYGSHREIDYMVMERLPGVTLADYIEQRGLELVSIEEALDVLIAIGETLAVLHEAGLAHRDLKPENVMMSGHGRVVLLDCGIACHERFVTGDRAMWGSPAHMAPESIQGVVRSGEAHLTDLYALATVAFELLTLGPVFVCDSLKDMLHQHLHNDPPRLATLRPEVPRELDALVSQMLRKKPEERPASIETVNTALRCIRAALRAPAVRPAPLAERAQAVSPAVSQAARPAALPSVRSVPAPARKIRPRTAATRRRGVGSVAV